MNLRLSHIGLVVHNLSEVIEIFRRLGLSEMTEPEPDPIQKVLACFITAGEGQKIHIEILEPTDESSPISNFLKKRGGGLHHLCFEVSDIKKTAHELMQKGFRMVSEPVECIGYDRSFKDTCGEGTKIAFFLINHILIELLQKGRQK
jgi:methylmalonyl-CoA/ethylmalonyl-CoA epimerase